VARALLRAVSRLFATPLSAPCSIPRVRSLAQPSVPTIVRHLPYP